MKLFSEDISGSAGVIVMFVFGLLLVGFFYVAFGLIMDQFQISNNALISNPFLPYSQDRSNSMNLIFQYWWAVPIYAIILFLVWGIKNALEKEAGEI